MRGRLPASDRLPGKETPVAGRAWSTMIADAVEERLPRSMAAVVRRLRSEDVFLLSAGLSFYALVSVVPFAVLVLWLVSLVTGKARVHEVADQLARHLPANLGVENALQSVADLGAWRLRSTRCCLCRGGSCGDAEVLEETDHVPAEGFVVTVDDSPGVRSPAPHGNPASGEDRPDNVVPPGPRVPSWCGRRRAARSSAVIVRVW